jgi:hypothetical protein
MPGLLRNYAEANTAWSAAGAVPEHSLGTLVAVWKYAAMSVDTAASALIVVNLSSEFAHKLC